MFFNNNLSLRRLQAAFRSLLVAAFMILNYSAAAQNAPTPVSASTGDKVLYGRHSASACNSMQQQKAVS